MVETIDEQIKSKELAKFNAQIIKNLIKQNQPPPYSEVDEMEISLSTEYESLKDVSKSENQETVRLGNTKTVELEVTEATQINNEVRETSVKSQMLENPQSTSREQHLVNILPKIPDVTPATEVSIAEEQDEKKDFDGMINSEQMKQNQENNLSSKSFLGINIVKEL